jgi:hypothetical protein
LKIGEKVAEKLAEKLAFCRDFLEQWLKRNFSTIGENNCSCPEESDAD